MRTEHSRLPGTSGRKPCVAAENGCAPSGRLPRRTDLSASTQMKEIRRQLGRRGFSMSKTNSGHWRFEHPGMDGPVFAPDTPSDRRGIRNLHAMLRRKMRSSIL